MQEELDELKIRVDKLETYLANLMGYVLNKHVDKDEKAAND